MAAWTTGDVSVAGVRSVADGFEFLRMQTPSFGWPVITDPVLLHISPPGEPTQQPLPRGSGEAMVLFVTMSMWTLPYWVYLLAISLLFVLFERIRPWRRQRTLRTAFDTDLLYLFFNGYLLALIITPMANLITPYIDAVVVPYLGRDHVGGFSFWPQFLVAFFVIDFVKWCIHVALHHVPFLWSFHRVHHSITEMDWIGNMRFHWMEIVVYNGVLYIPMLLLGFDWHVLLVMALLSTAIGHFNHSNVRLSLGPLKYLINHPGMHIWHHDYVMHYGAGCNFGINLSLWDWIFRTAYYPKDTEQPARLGFKNIETFPTSFLAQQLVPLTTSTGIDRDN